MRIEGLGIRVFTLPTPDPREADGTLEWNATTLVLVELRCGGTIGLGYTYESAAAAHVVEDTLAPCVVGGDPFAIPMLRERMLVAVRNLGRAGVVACAISAVDVALWDLKAKLLELPLAALLGGARSRVPAYASGGFTSTGLDGLQREIEDYVDAGHRRIKIKIGRDPVADVERLRTLTAAAGPGIELMVDANGAYDRKQAVVMAELFASHGVRYFEEPVSSDDLEGLRLVRDRAVLDVAAGEYGYDALYFRRMLDAQAVDILQADATRCSGITGFLDADVLCDTHMIPLSAHCAPAIHAHAGAAARRLVHVEQFRDHVRMEARLFDGVPQLVDGALVVDAARPGLGLVLRADEARRLAA